MAVPTPRSPRSVDDLAPGISSPKALAKRYPGFGTEETWRTRIRQREIESVYIGRRCGITEQALAEYFKANTRPARRKAS